MEEGNGQRTSEERLLRLDALFQKSPLAFPFSSRSLSPFLPSGGLQYLGVAHRVRGFRTGLKGLPFALSAVAERGGSLDEVQGEWYNYLAEKG